MSRVAHRLIGVVALLAATSSPLFGGEPVCLTPAGGHAPCLTPDGKSVVYVRSDGADTNLYVVPMAGGTPKRLTKEGGDSPSVSPDGKWVAFVSRRTGLSKLYLIRPSGEDERPLNDERTWDTTPTWWPDGRSVVYSTLSKQKRGIFRTDLKTGESTQLHPTGSSPAISPDGKFLAFVETDRNANGQETWIKELPDGQPRKLLGDLGTPQGGYFDPAWDSTGSRLFFTVMRMQPASNVGFLDVGSGEVTMLTTDDLGNRSPRPTPAGKQAIFTSRRGESKRERVWRMGLPD